MGTCEFCGNRYDKSFTITMAGDEHVFDSFECAIQLLAPACSNCGVKIIGHGHEADGVMYCSAHCARQEGITALRDDV
jgi:hypothetical protein